uniref:SH3GL interacting endocytic adaptor 1 n=1 Tax=Meleagris gallopavo TaxID=9103 RepID=G1NH67_MELGA
MLEVMLGLKKRTRKAFGIRKKEKDTDSTPHLNEPPCHSKPEGTREQGKNNSKKTNGAPNGFYAEIDWDRYNSPELDEEGYSIRPEEPGYILWKHFYSSSESEEEEEAHKKYNIKIKPLQAKDILKSAATVDELKASVGNIALSPSPVVSEEIARPRRSTPTPEPSSRKPLEDPAALAPLFGPPLESAFEEQKLDGPEIWGSFQPNSTESPKLQRPFPIGTPPPLPPKNIPATPPRTASPLTVAPGGDQPATEAKSDKPPTINDLDSIFGPVLSPKSVAAHAENKWVNFSDPSPENTTAVPRPREPAASPPVVMGSPGAEPPRALPSPLRLDELQKKALEQPYAKEENAEPAVASPKEFGPGQRATPPPPPPPPTVQSCHPPGRAPAAEQEAPAVRPAAPLCFPCPRPPCRPPPCSPLCLVSDGSESLPKAFLPKAEVFHQPFPPLLCVYTQRHWEEGGSVCSCVICRLQSEQRHKYFR